MKKVITPQHENYPRAFFNKVRSPSKYHYKKWTYE